MGERIEGRVSVVVPVCNMARFLSEAIASAEAQGHDDLELIVVDDGSTDETPEVVAGFGDRVVALRQENAGPAAARNAGLAAASGEVIAFLDADDLWPAGKLATQLARLEREPELDAVLGQIRYVVLEGGRLPGPLAGADDATATQVMVGSGLYRRRVFDRIGEFDASLRYAEDFDWFLRAREAQVRMVILSEVTLIYRIHDANMTRAAGDAKRLDTMKVLQRSIARRRAAGAPGALPPWSDYEEGVTPR